MSLSIELSTVEPTCSLLILTATQPRIGVLKTMTPRPASELTPKIRHKRAVPTRICSGTSHNWLMYCVRSMMRCESTVIRLVGWPTVAVPSANCATRMIYSNPWTNGSEICYDLKLLERVWTNWRFDTFARIFVIDISKTKILFFRMKREPVQKVSVLFFYLGNVIKV